MNNNNNDNNSFFDFDDEYNTDIALSKEELFSILDQANTKELKKRKSEIDNIKIKQNQDNLDVENYTENFKSNNEENTDNIIVFSIKELVDEYEKKKKLKYYIVEKSDDNLNYDYKSERNTLLDKFSESKIENIIEEENDLILDDNLEIVDSTEKDNEKDGIKDLKDKNYDFNELDYSDKNKEISKNSDIDIEEIKKVIKYLDELMDSLPNEKVEEFVKSEYYALYKKMLSEINNLK